MLTFNMKKSAYVIWSEEGKQVICVVCEPEPKSGHVLYEKLQIGSKNFDIAMDNAAFILRACNSHANLLETLEELVAIVDGAREEGYDNIDSFTTQPARKAIEKAR